MTEFNVDGAASGRFEGTCQIQVLRGCPTCHTKHPLANNPPINSDVCLGCGAPVIVPGEIIDADAKLTGWSPAILLARFLMWVARGLHNIAKGL